MSHLSGRRSGITPISWSHVKLLLAFSVVMTRGDQRWNQSCQSSSVISGLSPKAAKPGALKNVCACTSQLYDPSLQLKHKTVHMKWCDLPSRWKQYIEQDTSITITTEKISLNVERVITFNILLCLAYITNGSIVSMETRQMSLTAKLCYFPWTLCSFVLLMSL